MILDSIPLMFYKIFLYSVVIGYPMFEFVHEKVTPASYEGVGSIAFPIVILTFEIIQWRGKNPRISKMSVLAELLSGFILATLTQLVYLAAKGYQQETNEMRQMIRMDWIVLPFLLLWLLWLLRRKKSD